MRRALPPALLIVGALLLAVPASARIVPQQGIAGVKLNMLRSQVVAVKGRPSAERIVENEILGPHREMRYGKTRISFGGTDATAGVIAVRTTSRNERTRSGVGVGSTRAEVKAGVAGITCSSEFDFDHCWKGEFLPGQRVTDFFLDGNAKVTTVTVGFVID